MADRKPAQPPPAKRAQRRTNTGRLSAEAASEQGKQRTDKGTKPAQIPPKRTRKARRVSEGALLRKELARKSDKYDVRLLIQQAARHADRLQAIDELLSGSKTAWLALKLAGNVVEVKVDGLLVEESKRIDALRKIILDIHRIRANLPPDPDRTPTQDPVTRISKGR